MIKRIFTILIIIFILSSCAKDEKEITVCETERYVDQIFTEVEKSTVDYGSNINTSGQKVILKMDIYQPKGDTLAKRPVIVLAFGGSFLFGDRTQLSDLAIETAKLGYVSVCIDYRLLNFITDFPIDSVKGLDIAIKASGDMKAAIRYLRKDAATSNNYKIDPDMIITGGVSSGAITALQAAYFDESDNIEANVKQAVLKNGGIEGSSGDAENLLYSSKVQGVINLSGAIYRLDFMDNGEPPISSFHGDNDEVVPYGYGFAKPGGFEVIKLYGSSEIHKKAEQIGINSFFTTVSGGGHDDIYSDEKFKSQFEAFKKGAYIFNKKIICN